VELLARTHQSPRGEIFFVYLVARHVNTDRRQRGSATKMYKLKRTTDSVWV